MKYLTISQISAYGIEGTKSGLPGPSSAPRPAIVARVQAWILANCRFTKTVCQDPTSYGWKHTAENFIGEYVSNGEFIVAAIQAGAKAVQAHDGPNAFFNIEPNHRTPEIRTSLYTKLNFIW